MTEQELTERKTIENELVWWKRIAEKAALDAQAEHDRLTARIIELETALEHAHQPSGGTGRTVLRRTRTNKPATRSATRRRTPRPSARGSTPAA